MSDPRVTVADGTRLRVRVDGEGGRPWLVLSNGLATGLEMWDGQIAALTTRYRVLRYDARGHGGSDAPAGPVSLATLVADVVGLLDHHDIPRAAFMGLSLGGMTGLGLALARPQRLTRLVCCAARADAPPAYVQGWAGRIAAVTAGGLAAIAPGTLERWLTPATQRNQPETVRALERMILSTSAAGYTACAAALQQLDYLESLHRIICPTLFVAGAEDLAAPAATMREMAARLPASGFALVADAAHIIPSDNPAGFHAAIAGFLELPA